MCAHLTPGQPWICSTCGKAGPVFVGLSPLEEMAEMMKQGWDFVPITGSAEVCSEECKTGFFSPYAYHWLAYGPIGGPRTEYRPISEQDIGDDWSEITSNEQRCDP